MSLFRGKAEEAAAAPAGKRRVTRRSLLAGAAGLIGLSAGGNRRLCRQRSNRRAWWSRRYALKPRGWPAGRKLSITVIADLHAGGPDMPLPHMRSGSSIPPTR